MGVPTHPSVGDRWFECWICGFYFPLSEGIRHYRSQRLVDKNCDDQKAHFEIMAETTIPTEAEANRRIVSEQPVTCQGEVVGTRWYEGRFYEGKWYDPG